MAAAIGYSALHGRPDGCIPATFQVLGIAGCALACVRVFVCADGDAGSGARTTPPAGMREHRVCVARWGVRYPGFAGGSMAPPVCTSRPVLRVTGQVVYMIGWKPDPSQPKACARGSGQRLKDVLE